MLGHAQGNIVQQSVHFRVMLLVEWGRAIDNGVDHPIRKSHCDAYCPGVLVQEIRWTCANSLQTFQIGDSHEICPQRSSEIFEHIRRRSTPVADSFRTHVFLAHRALLSLRTWGQVLFLDLPVTSQTRLLGLDQARGLFTDHRHHRLVKKQDLTPSADS